MERPVNSQLVDR